MKNQTIKLLLIITIFSSCAIQKPLIVVNGFHLIGAWVIIVLLVFILSAWIGDILKKKVK